jgi:2-amino-4-hydroxy-6-hydroxymethyldihydropteridine diphosphokinase
VAAKVQDDHATRAYIGIGSNLDDPVLQVLTAIAALARLPRTQVARCSRLYRSPPLGPQEQPDYVNAVAAIDTGLTAQALLAELQSLERRQGRRPSAERWGPRCIDLDILVFGVVELHSAELAIPHPGLRGRDFVLWPLFEIAPDLEVPGAGPLAELLQSCPQRGLACLDRVSSRLLAESAVA